MITIQPALAHALRQVTQQWMEQHTMVITELLGERCLLKVGKTLYRDSEVQEYKILEVSPSGQWVKLMTIHGTKFWKPVVEVSLVEVLKSLKPEEPRPTLEPREGFQKSPIT